MTGRRILTVAGSLLVVAVVFFALGYFTVMRYVA